MKQAPIIWTNVLLFSLTTLVAAIGVPWYALTIGFGWFEIIATIICLGYCGMSITAGYHRLWAHKTYDAHPILQYVYAIGGAFALQNSALHWAADHRVHHRHVDNNDKDPYSAGRGFWYSHIGWMLRDYAGDNKCDYNNARDLQKNTVVMWQHRNYLWLAIATNFGIPLLLGVISGNILGMLLSAGVLRLVLSHHFTFFINSLAHIWGKQPYTEQNSARDNGLLAFLTYGEGYHNFHHIFESDYRNGIKWYQFDPTKWFIKAASWLGLTRNLRIVPEELIAQAKAKMQLQRAKERVKQRPNAEQLLQLLEQEYELLLARMQDYYQLKKQLLLERKELLVAQYHAVDFKIRYQEFKHHLQLQQQHWQRLVTAFS